MSLLKDKIEIEIQEAELSTQKALAEFPPLIRWFTIIIVILILPAYFVTKNVSYKIWSNRFTQGALTAKPSFTDPQALKVSNVYLTTLGPNQFAAAVLVTNPNLDLSIKDLPFQFSFLNKEQQPLYTYSGNLFLLPNESKYITVPTFNSPENISYANFNVTTNEIKWQKKLSIPKVNLTTSLPKTGFQTNPVAFFTEGDFTNNSPYLLKSVQLTFLLYDAGGTIIGISQRNEATVQPFEKRSYKQLWPNMNGDNVVQARVDASTNVLDQNNLQLPNSGGGAGSLERPENNRR